MRSSPRPTTVPAEYAPFFIRPIVPKVPICFLAPTASYLAYANSLDAFYSAALEAIRASTPILQEVDIEVHKNDLEFGLSTYDTHRDGAGGEHRAIAP